jgi:hypothetical protein
MDRDQFELVVETAAGGGLRVTITEPVGYDGFQFDLDDGAAHDLLNQLESWRAGWFAGPPATL